MKAWDQSTPPVAPPPRWRYLSSHSRKNSFPRSPGGQRQRRHSAQQTTHRQPLCLHSKQIDTGTYTARTSQRIWTYYWLSATSLRGPSSSKSHSERMLDIFLKTGYQMKDKNIVFLLIPFRSRGLITALCQNRVFFDVFLKIEFFCQARAHSDNYL